MRRSSDFSAVVRRGRRAGRSRLVVHLRATDADGPVLVGLVVSRAVGGSVVRNRVERRLRHLMRDRLSMFGPGTRVVVRATPPAATSSSSEMATDLDAALRRLIGAR